MGRGTSRRGLRARVPANRRSVRARPWARMPARRRRPWRRAQPRRARPRPAPNRWPGPPRPSGCATGPSSTAGGDDEPAPCLTAAIVGNYEEQVERRNVGRKVEVRDEAVVQRAIELDVARARVPTPAYGLDHHGGFGLWIEGIEERLRFDVA